MLLVVRLLCIDCLCTYVNKGGFLITVDSDYAEVFYLTVELLLVQHRPYNRCHSELIARCQQNVQQKVAAALLGPHCNDSLALANDWFAYLALGGYARRRRWAFVRARVCLMTSSKERANSPVEYSASV
ncbi:hypothetical protein T4E_8199 [Trichinella pseudospiralis]|uniref:Uncharacterized protein n=1 Tax=Trichinella pseudospiralis TaxID=6337 RepID=A0A0V0Y2W4_TRIPS|nr:hypothetical protein T4E_8199 [Trichinella pseudospiralis]